jgi:SAM-dependent methyltransferase
MSNLEKDVIHFKTDAWKDRNTVAWYSGRMVENTGSNRLKNIIETELCERFLQGANVLDVGIGTGRASLPLIAKGYRLSGVDSSQAMLDECKRLAGNAPLELKVGDVQSLPFPDKNFDNLIALNVMTHFPHVEKVLREWKRVVKPGGRLVFDIYSLDHLSYARGREVTVEELIAEGAKVFNMHLSRESLHEIANNVGLKIVSTVPYGSFLSGEYHHPFFPQPLQATHWWRRQLSWLASDDALLDMGLFLEREWFGCLNGHTTGRFMVVLENTEGEQANNQTWLEQDLQLSQYLTQSQIRLDGLAPWLTLSPDTWRATFDSHLDRLRNRSVAYFMLTSFLGRPDAIDWGDLAPRNGPKLQRWAEAENIDRGLRDLARSWHRNDAVADLCSVGGVNMGAALEYQLQQGLVRQCGRMVNGN